MTRLKFTLVSRDRNNVTDVVVVAAEHETIGTLVDRLEGRHVSSDDAEQDGLEIAPDTADVRLVAPHTPIGASGLRSGDVVAPVSHGFASPPADVVGSFEIVSAPSGCDSCALVAGVSTIGRSTDCDIVLRDPNTAPRHARLVVGDRTEIFDLGTAQGIYLNGRRVERTQLGSDDEVRLGDTVARVRLNDHHGAIDTGNVLTFNRSPVVIPTFDGLRLVAPEPPQPPAPHRFPLFTLIAPVAMAVGLFAITRSVFSVIFLALTPLMLVGSWIESRRSSRRQLRDETVRFRSALSAFETTLIDARELEQATRRREHPSLIELIDAATDRSALLWSRRPEHDLFATVRLGVGTLTSRTTIASPSGGRTLPDLWNELDSLAETFATVPEVPVVADLDACGNLGIAAPHSTAAQLTNGLVAQVATLYSPTEIRIVALGGAGRLDWLKWLPHTDRASSPVDAEHLAADAGETAATLDAIEVLMNERREADGADLATADERPAPSRVLVLVDDDALIDRSRLVQLVEHGPTVGIHTIWTAPARERLPAACRAFVESGADVTRARAGFVTDGRVVDLMLAEPLGARTAEHLARALSHVVDSAGSLSSRSDLPPNVSLGDLLGPTLSAREIQTRWEGSSRAPSQSGLRAPIGTSAFGSFHLDLRTDGPHALVAGTTGSGKSEFLRSWILSLAATYDPQHLTFLLIDYKGGAAFAECADLPHTVGLVTDLDGGLARRALRSLDAELRHRERVLRSHGVADLGDLEQGRERPPRLVIVIDEFATLLSEVPEFVDGIVNIAQRGRSLGLHLILATQRPTGVVQGNIRANTNLRITLRMAEAADSVDLIGSADAMHLDPARPGRAIARIGSGRTLPFQSAFAGMRSRREHSVVEIATLRFGGPHPWPRPPHERTGGPTDAQQLVEATRAAFTASGQHHPRAPWLPELSTLHRLDDLPEAPAGELGIGLTDDPDAQAQPLATFDPGSEGNLAVVGAGGTGKTCCLRVVAAAAARSSEPFWVYGLDFAGRGLAMLDDLPIVSDIVHGDDTTRVLRLIELLEDLVDGRIARYTTAGASNIDEFRSASAAHDEARVIVLVDDVGQFRDRFEAGPHDRWWDGFVRVAAKGRPAGVHVVMSAGRPAAVSSALAATVPRTIVLRLANDLDYALVGASAHDFSPTTPPGRGLLYGRSVQVASLADGGTAAESEAIRLVAASIEPTGAIPKVRVLPDLVRLSDLPADVDGNPTIGLADHSLDPVGVDPSGTFLIAGDARSGRSTALAALATSLTTILPDTTSILFTDGRSELTETIAWRAVARGTDEATELATSLADRAGRLTGSLFVIIESIDRFVDGPAADALARMIESIRAARGFVVAEGERHLVASSWPLLVAAKRSRAGLLLRPDPTDGDLVLRTPVAVAKGVPMPPGRGLLVQHGSTRTVQVAVAS